MKHSFSITLAILITILTAHHVSAQYSYQESQTARTIWLKGFDVYEKAESAKKVEDLKTALSMFEEALTSFQKVKIRYPKWNSNLVLFRIKLCEREIGTLKQELQKKNIKITETEIEMENRLLKDRVSAIEKQHRNIQEQLETTLNSLESARLEAARGMKASDEVKKLVKEKTELEKKYALLADEYKRLQSEKEGKDKDKKWRERIEEERLKNEKLKKENAALLNNSNNLKTIFQKTASAKAQLEYDLKESKEKLEEINSEIEKYTENILVLKENLKRSESLCKSQGKEIDELNIRMEKEKQESEKLHKELKDMRKNTDLSDISKQLESDNEILRRNVDMLQNNIDKERREKNEIQAKYEMLGIKLSQTETLLVNLQNQYKGISEELDTVKIKNVEFQSRAEQQEENIRKLEAQNEGLKTEFDSVAGQYAKLQEKESEFTGLAKHCAAIETENRNLKEKLAKIAEENNVLKKEHDTALANSAAFQDKYKKLMRIRTGLEQTNLELKKKVEIISEELKQSKGLLNQKDLEISEVCKKVKNGIQEKSKVNELLKKLNEKEEEIENLKTMISARVPASTPDAPFMAVNPEEIKSLLDSAEAAEKENNRETAIWHYEKVMEKCPDNLEASSRLGLLFAESGNDDKARIYLEKALRDDPEDVEKLLTLGFIYIRQGKYHLALGALGQATEQDPRNPDLQRYLGIACSYLEWTAAAEKQFRLSFELDPTSPDTAFNLAVLLATSAPEKIEEAKKWYKKARELGAESDPGIERLFE